MKLYAQLHAEAKIGSQGREEYYGNKTKYYFNLWCDTRNTIRAMAKIHGGAMLHSMPYSPTQPVLTGQLQSSGSFRWFISDVDLVL